MWFDFSFGLGALVIVVILAAASIKILREYERAVVFLLGRFQAVKGPGLIIIIPVIQQMVRVDLRTVVLDVPPQDVITRDNVSVKVNAVVYFRVVDAQHAIIQVVNFLEATSQLAQTTLRAVLGKHELDELLSERERLNLDIQSILDSQTNAWGIKVSNVEIKHVDLNETMVRAIKCPAVTLKPVTPAAVPASPEPLSDGELAQRVAGGDVRALEALMRRHNRALFRTSRAILRDDADAEEALQDGYLRAFRAIGAFRGESRLSTWLVRIVANEALMRLRKRRRGAEVVPLYGEDMPTEDRPDYAAQRAQTRRLLEQKIDALPEAYRVVFILRALEEFSVEETAAALGIPEATVRTRFFRARRVLREALSTEIDLALDEVFAFAGERCDRIVAGVLARLE